jgi:peptidoglycan/LPS O-acetylase OafA/YrhL
MSQDATAAGLADTRQRDHRAVAVLAVAVYVVTSALTIYGADDRWEIAIVMTLIAGTLLGIYGYLLPRELTKARPSRAALVLSIAAVILLLPAFWSGESLLLGAAGALLGYRNRKAPAGAGRSIAALLLGLLASIGYLAIYVMDALLPPGT